MPRGRWASGRGKGKYGNLITTYQGRRFHSRKEARRYEELLLLARAGVIQALELQPRYPLTLNGIKICTYVADFRYVEQGQTVVEDVKSDATRRLAAYRIKKQLMAALYGIVIRET